MNMQYKITIITGLFFAVSSFAQPLPKGKRESEEEVSAPKRVASEPSSSLAANIADAAGRGDVDAVEALIAAGAPLDEPLADNAARKAGCTPMHIAAALGHAGVVNALAALGAPVNQPLAAAGDFGGRTPMQIAAARGYAGVVNALAALGAPVNEPVAANAAAYGGWTPMQIATNRGHAGVVNALAALGAPVNEPVAANATGTFGGWTPMQIAANNGHAGVVNALTALGAPVNEPVAANATGTFGGWTPMHIAANRGHAGVINALAALGAPVNEPVAANAAGGGWTPIQITANLGHVAALRALLDAGANPDPVMGRVQALVPDYFDDVTQIHGDALWTRITHHRVLRDPAMAAGVLNRLGLNNPAGLTEERTAILRLTLLTAVREGFIETAEILLNAGAQPHLAAQFLVALQQRGALATHPNREWYQNLWHRFRGATNLFAEDRRAPQTRVGTLPADVLPLLANFTLTNRYLQTRIETAIRAGRLNQEVLNLFVNGQIDINAVIANGMTAIELAATFDNIEAARGMVQQLLALHANPSPTFAGLMALNDFNFRRRLEVIDLLVRNARQRSMPVDLQLQYRLDQARTAQNTPGLIWGAMAAFFGGSR